MDHIVIKGAKENNLKNIDLTIPRNKVVCFVGVSGSGKSTIAFDVIAKEGQRQYFESLSSLARRYLQKSNRPDVEEIIYRYLSHLSYHYKIPVEVRATHSGSIDISVATKRSEPRLGIYYPIPSLLSLEENQSRAVAFYRQFRNFSRITTTESRYYQMMSLLKTIEGVNPSADLTKNKNDFINLIDSYLSELSSENKSLARGIESKYKLKYSKVAAFSEILWEHYRNGIAHWRARGNFLDPDIPDNTIASSINILEQICLKVLSNEYKILS